MLRTIVPVSAVNFPGPVLLAGAAKIRQLDLAERMIDRGFDVVVAADAAVDRTRQLAGWFAAAVLDIGAAGRHALANLAELHAEWPLLPILVLACDDSPDLSVAVLRAGGDACISALRDDRCLELEARLLGLHRRGVLARLRL